jgi:hypothetical protein
MKFAGKSFLAGSLIALGLTSNAIGQQADCRAVAAEVQALIKGAPAMTLTVVEDALVANPNCVCEIVTTAIAASNADAAMVKRIVYTAVTTTQQHAPAIAECAVAAAPAYADAVRAAFAEAFEDDARKDPKKKPAQVASNQNTQPKPQQAKPQQQTAPPQQQMAQQQTAPRQSVTAPAETATLYSYDGGKMVVSEVSGKEVVEYQPAYAYDPKGIAASESYVEPAVPGSDTQFGDWTSTLFHGPPMALTGLYLVPPVASAPPFDPEVEEKDDDEPRRKVSFPPRRSPQRPPVIVSIPMSPTGP